LNLRRKGTGWLRRRSPLTVAFFVLIIALALISIIAHIPGPTPTSQTITKVGQSSQLQSYAPTGGQYVYGYFTDDPGWNFNHCVTSMVGDTLHSLFPFHNYFTSTLVFELAFSQGIQPGQPTGNAPPFLIVQANPSTGQIYTVTPHGLFCA